MTKYSVRIWISQPMKDLDQETIEERRGLLAAKLESISDHENFYHVYPTERNLDGCFDEDQEAEANESTELRLARLAESIKEMGTCEAVCFAKGWEESEGCRVEHAAATLYGLKILYEKDLVIKPEPPLEYFEQLAAMCRYRADKVKRSLCLALMFQGFGECPLKQFCHRVQARDWRRFYQSTITETWQ